MNASTIFLPQYACFKQSNWRVTINVLIKVLKEGIPLVRETPNAVERFSQFWGQLASVLEHFLFPESVQEQRQEDRMADEAVDCHIIELLREEVLPFPNAVPPSFITKIVVLLNKGSIHSSIQLNEECSGSVGLREGWQICKIYNFRSHNTANCRFLKDMFRDPARLLAPAERGLSDGRRGFRRGRPPGV